MNKFSSWLEKVKGKSTVIRNWSKKTSSMFIMLILFFPIGLYLVWKDSDFSNASKRIITVLVILVFSVVSINHLEGSLVMARQAEDISEMSTNYEVLKTTYSDYKEEMAPFEKLSQNEKEIAIKDNEQLKYYTDAVEALPTIDNVSLDDASSVSGLQNLFDKLSEKQRKDIGNKTVEMYTKKINELKKADEERVKKEEAEAKKKKEQEEKEAKQKKEREEEARKKREEEERIGFDTGITYDQLSRTPDDYMMKKVKFYGKVVQVMEGDGDTVQLRLAVNDDYHTIMYVEYDSDIVSKRVLKDDYITISGVSMGLLSYKSTMGGTITIPSVVVSRIDQ